MLKNQNQLPQKVSRKYRTSAIILGILAAFLAYPVTSVIAQEVFASSTEEVKISTAVFNIPQLEAAAVSVYDPVTKQFLYQKNADEVRPIASITKLLTGMVVQDILNFKNPPKTISIKKIVPETKIDRELKVGEQWNTYDFLRFMLMTSSNTAAETFGTQIFPYSSFISMMNYKAKNLGLTTIKTVNTTGLPVRQIKNGKTTETPSAYGSANDVAKLLAETYKSYPGLIGFTSEYRGTFVSKLKGKNITRQATSTNELLATLPDVMGGKTGFTDASGGNLAVLVKTTNGSPVIIVVLGSSLSGRFADVAALASSTQLFISSK